MTSAFNSAFKLLREKPWDMLSTVQRRALYSRFERSDALAACFVDDENAKYRLELVNYILEGEGVPEFEVANDIE